MGTFVETAIIDYCYRLLTKENKLLFSFSICSKQTQVCPFHFLFAANKRKLQFSVNSIFCIFIYICCRFKWKIEAQTIFLFPFTVAQHANVSLRFVCLLTKKINRSYPFANGPNGLNGLAHL
jgi:hypothetical protein